MDFRGELSRMLQNETRYVFDVDLLEYSKKMLASRSEIPRLYRYVPANYNNIRSLETNSLFLPPMGVMNDVFEGMSGYVDEDSVLRLPELYDIMYMKAFSEQKDSLVMWGTYAENYTGLCIEYDLSNMKQQEYYYHLFPVCYQQKRLHLRNNIEYIADAFCSYKKGNGIDEADAAFLSDLYSIYLAKSSQWVYEKEWRLLVSYVHMHEQWQEGGILSDDEVYEQYAINKQNISFPYVSSVYVGPRAPENVKEHIIEICERNKIPVYLTQLSMTEYELDLLDVSRKQIIKSSICDDR